MKEQQSPSKEGSDGYTRTCLNCGGDMPWIWGGPITYFKCTRCERIEPCSNVVIEPKLDRITIEDGNRKEVYTLSEEDFKDTVASLKDIWD